MWVLFLRCEDVYLLFYVSKSFASIPRPFHIQIVLLLSSMLHSLENFVIARCFPDFSAYLKKTLQWKSCESVQLVNTVKILPCEISHSTVFSSPRPCSFVMILGALASTNAKTFIVSFGSFPDICKTLIQLSHAPCTYLTTVHTLFFGEIFSLCLSIHDIFMWVIQLQKKLDKPLFPIHVQGILYRSFFLILTNKGLRSTF